MHSAESASAPTWPALGAGGGELRRRSIEAALFGEVEAVSLGHYRLLEQLGAGGMGRVYAAYDEQLDRKIALKLIREDRPSEELRERTRREAQALAKVSHPNVVHVYEVGEANGEIFVAMEFLAGPTLRRWLDQHKRQWPEVLAVFRQAGEGLAAAHAAGIIHRDFKPHNVMLGADGRVRVLDFGLARLGQELDRAQEDVSIEQRRTYDLGSTDTGHPQISEELRSLTMTGAILGTPAYMAPEQLVGSRVDARSDQFSFCVALYEALYGRRPYTMDSLMAWASGSGEAETDVARPRDAGVPRWVHRALVRGLARDPSRRWPSMHALLVALTRSRESRIGRMLGGAALAVALTGAGGWLLRTQAPPVQDCPDARAELAGIWDEAQISAVERSLTENFGVSPEDRGPTLRRLTKYSDTWVEMRRDTCEARAAGRESGQLFALRMVCLNQRRAALDAITKALAAPEGVKWENLAIAATDLPPLARCSDREGLMADIAPPDDPTLRQEVERLRELLARVKVHSMASQYDRAMELVDEVLASPAVQVYEPLLAEAYLGRARALMFAPHKEQEENLTKAIAAAIRANHVLVAAETISWRGYIRALELDRPELAFAEIPEIDAWGQRARADGEVYHRYLGNVSIIYMTVGDYDMSRQKMKETLVLEPNQNDESMARLRAISLINLGVMETVQGRWEASEALCRETIRWLVASLGRGTSHQFSSEAKLCDTLAHLGRPREAESLAIEMLERPSYDNVRQERLSAIARLVRLELEAQRPEVLERLSAQLAKYEEPSDEDTTAQCSWILIAAARGDASGVASHYQAALKDGMRILHEWELRWCHAEALESLGQLDEALGALEDLRMLAPSLPIRMKAEAPQLLAAQGRLRRRLGHHAEAARDLTQALRDLDELWIERSPTHADILAELGALALTEGQMPAAVEHLRQAESLYAASSEWDYTPLARTRFALARALQAGAAVDAEARTLAAKALEAFAAKGRREEATEVEAWLQAWDG